jgi:polyisoprenyl-phosphate glycosyltransferase
MDQDWSYDPAMLSERKQPLSRLCVVSPVHNECAGIQTFFQHLVANLEQTQLEYQLVFVDDGSQDDSLSLLLGLASQNNRVSVLSFSRNFGHQAALTAGLDYAAATGADAVLVLDSDLQHPPHVMHQMIDLFRAGADVVYGVRRSVQGVSLPKRLFSDGFYLVFKFILGRYAIRRAADFRLSSITATQTLAQMREYHRYLRGMSQWMGFATAIVEYDQPARYAGRPSFTIWKSLQMALNAIFSFSLLPLRVISLTGCSFALAGLLYLGFIVYSSYKGHVVEGWASTVSVILILGGVQLLALGVIAQYIGMIFEQAKNRPLYILNMYIMLPPTLRKLTELIQDKGKPLSDETLPDLRKQHSACLLAQNPKYILPCLHFRICK